MALVLLVSEEMGSKALFIPLIMSFLGVFVTNVILMDKLVKNNQPAPGETNEPGQQAPGKINENIIPAESLGKPKNQQAPGETSEKVILAKDGLSDESKELERAKELQFLTKTEIQQSKSDQQDAKKQGQSSFYKN